MVRVAAFWTALVGCALAVPGGLSRAAEPATAALGQDAKDHYKRAKTHYQLGEYRDALQNFKEAYRLKQEPALLFNIAQCHRLLREHAEALRSYQGYLRDAPGAANRAEVDRMIRDLKKVMESTSSSAPTEKAPQSPEPPVIAPLPEVVLPPPTPPSVASPTPGEPIAAPVAAAASPPSSIAPNVATALSASPLARDAELHVIATAPDTNILINQSVVSRNSRATIRLPPGLYNVAVSKDDHRGAEGAVVLMAGDRQSVTGEVRPLKSHGWRKWGIVFLLVAALAEGGAQIAHHQANQKFVGSRDFENMAGLEKATQGTAIITGILGIASITIDILKNSDRVEPGPPSLLLPTPPGGGP